MSTDRELLELAAKAAGIDVEDHKGALALVEREWDDCWRTGEYWDPLNDDGDALRLALAVGINIFHGHAVLHWRKEFHGRIQLGHWAPEEMRRDDLARATRLAIVRAAAEIGKAMS